MSNTQKINIKKRKTSATIMVALFGALISAACFIQIPISITAIVIQDMLAFLAGLLLGPLYGGLAVLLFLVLGCIGLPIFTGGRSGIQVILSGATGGFLVGYLLGAIIAGLIVWLAFKKSGRKSNFYQWTVFFIAAFTATVIMFFCAVVHFMNVTDSTLVKTMAAIVIPFVPGNIIKLVVLVMLAKKFYPTVTNYLRG